MDELLGQATGPVAALVILLFGAWGLSRGDLRLGREYDEKVRQLNEALGDLQAERDERRAEREFRKEAVETVEHVATDARRQA